MCVSNETRKNQSYRTVVRRCQRLTALLLLSLVFFAVLSCDRKDNSSEPSDKQAKQTTDADLVFWTTEVESARMKTQEKLVDEFQENTGINVSVVPVQQSKMNQKVIANKAAGNLPDVIFTSASSANGWALSGILNPAAAEDVISSLNPDRFRGLHLLRVKNGYSMVPSDGWVNLTLYRSDLFKKHDLNPPTSWDRMLKAAETLHDLPDRFGVLVPTAPSNLYTLTTLEQIALSNDAHLLNENGNVDLNTQNMVEALRFYKKLAEYTPPGNYYWKQTRLYYFVGRTPQIFWSPFILGELAGEREEIEVGVPRLADKTGIETVLNGPRGSAGYISVNGFGMTSSAHTDRAKRFVRFMMSEGYEPFFQMDPFGKFPLRQGTTEQPKQFLNSWKSSTPLLERYSDRLIQKMIEGIDRADRWGLKQGKGELISKLYGTKVLSRILVRDFLRGSLSARETARKMNREARALQKEISASNARNE